MKRTGRELGNEIAEMLEGNRENLRVKSLERDFPKRVIGILPLKVSQGSLQDFRYAKAFLSEVNDYLHEKLSYGELLLYLKWADNAPDCGILRLQSGRTVKCIASKKAFQEKRVFYHLKDKKGCVYPVLEESLSAGYKGAVVCDCGTVGDVFRDSSKLTSTFSVFWDNGKQSNSISEHEMKNKNCGCVHRQRQNAAFLFKKECPRCGKVGSVYRDELAKPEEANIFVLWEDGTRDTCLRLSHDGGNGVLSKYFGCGYDNVDKNGNVIPYAKGQQKKEFEMTFNKETKLKIANEIIELWPNGYSVPESTLKGKSLGYGKKHEDFNALVNSIADKYITTNKPVLSAIWDNIELFSKLKTVQGSGYVYVPKQKKEERLVQAQKTFIDVIVENSPNPEPLGKPGELAKMALQMFDDDLNKIREGVERLGSLNPMAKLVCAFEESGKQKDNLIDQKDRIIADLSNTNKLLESSLQGSSAECEKYKADLKDNALLIEKIEAKHSESIGKYKETIIELHGENNKLKNGQALFAKIKSQLEGKSAQIASLESALTEASEKIRKQEQDHKDADEILERLIECNRKAVEDKEAAEAALNEIKNVMATQSAVFEKQSAQIEKVYATDFVQFSIDLQELFGINDLGVLARVIAKLKGEA